MDSPNNKPGTDGYSDWLEVVREQVNSLRFGAVEIVVHDSRVVQIEKTERVRLDRSQFEPRQGRTS